MARTLSVGILQLLFGFLFMAAAASAEAQQLPHMMVVKNRFVNVRKGPGTGYDQVATLYKGDKVEAERKFREWLRVVLDDGRIGWLRGDLVEPWDPSKDPLTDVQADSLKAMVEMRAKEISALEDSSKAMLAMTHKGEDMRDSLMKTLGLMKMPPSDTLLPSAMHPEMKMQPVEPLPGRQASVITQKEEPFARRYEFTPHLGVLISDGRSFGAGGMSVARNFTRELAWTAQVSFARSAPEAEGSLFGDFEHVFIIGGLIYNHNPGHLVVPYLELGTGGIYTQAADSSFTALDLSFGAGFRLYLTPDIALRAGYQGHGMMAEGNRLLSLVYIGGSLSVPPYVGGMSGWPMKDKYLEPYAAWQVYSRRFSINAAPAAGLLAGYRVLASCAAEFMAGYQALTVNDGLEARSLTGAELLARVLYYPWGGYNGPYVTAGGGALLLGSGGRPPEGTGTYGAFLYGAGVNLSCGRGMALRGEMLHLIYPNVASIGPESSVAPGSALRVGAGLKFSF